MTHDEVFDMTQQLINQRIYERNHPMKTVIIKTEDGRVVAMLVQQPAVQTEQDFNALATALLLTLANNTGLQLITEVTQCASDSATAHACQQHRVATNHRGDAMKIAELTGAALDWAVAKCEGIPDTEYVRSHLYAWPYSTDWAQGGPIIERECIAVRYNADSHGWYACAHFDTHGQFGDTPLIAAMRCYVASKLGDEVEIPQELIK